MEFPKVLVFYKRSNYEQYVLKEHSAKLKKHRAISKPLLESHRAHYESLDLVEKTLDDLQIRYSIFARGHAIDEKKYDLIITVGGDGTFLEAAQYVTSKPMVGVNSNPKESVGFFCAVLANDLATFLKRKKHRQCVASRLRIEIDGKVQRPALNDVLITNIHPASTSRYTVEIKDKKEEQKSSGIWISTALGSTAAIRGAGGRRLHRNSSNFQIKIREPYFQGKKRPALDRMVLKENDQITLVSWMRDGRVYMDGTKRVSSFIFGSKVIVSGNAPKLRILGKS